MSATTASTKLFSRQYAVSLDEKIQLSGKRSQENMRKIGELKASLSSLLVSQSPPSVSSARNESVHFPNIVATVNNSQLSSSSPHVSTYLEKAQEEVRRLTEANHELTLECVRLREMQSCSQQDPNTSDIVHSPKLNALSLNAPELVEEVESFLSRLITLHPHLLADIKNNESFGAESVCSLFQSLEDPILNALSLAKTATESLETNADLVDLAHQQEEERGADYERLAEIITALEQTNQQLKKDAREKENVINILQQNESELRQSLDTLLGEKEDLVDKLKKVEAAKESERENANEKEIEALNEKVTSLTKQLEEKDKEVEETSEKVDAAFHRNLALIEEKQVLQENIENLTLKVQELTTEFQVLQVEKEALQKEKDSEAATFHTNKETVAASFAEEKQQLLHQIEELRQKNNILTDKMNVVNEDLEKAKKQNTEFETEVETLRANEKALTQEKLNAANVVSEHKKKIDGLENEKKTLQEQLENMSLMKRAKDEKEAANVEKESHEIGSPQSFINFSEVENTDSDEGFSYPEPADLSEWLQKWNVKSINDMYPVGEKAQTQLDSAGPLYHVGMCVTKEMGLNTIDKQWQRFLFQIQNTLDQKEETALSVIASDTMQVFFKLIKTTGLLYKLPKEVCGALATFALLFFVSEVTERSRFEAASYDILKHIESAGKNGETSTPNFYYLFESTSQTNMAQARDVLRKCIKTVAQEDRVALATKLLFDCRFAAEHDAVVENIDHFACAFLFFARTLVAARNVTDIRNSLRPQAETERVTVRFYALAVPLAVEIIRSFPVVYDDILAVLRSIYEDLEACSPSYPTLPELMNFIQAAIQKIPEGSNVVMSAEVFEATQKELLQVYMANEVCTHQLNSLLEAIEKKQVTG